MRILTAAFLPLLAVALSGVAVPVPSVQAATPENRGGVVIVLDGIEAGRFQEISGAGGEIEVEPYRNGDDPVTHKRPGRTKYSNITLKRGLSTTAALEAWVDAALTGQVQRKSGSIIYLDREGNEVLRLNFEGGFPASVGFDPEVKGKGRSPTMVLGIACTTLERGEAAKGKVQPGGYLLDVDDVPVDGVLDVSRISSNLDEPEGGTGPVLDAQNVEVTVDSLGGDGSLQAWFGECAKGKDIRKTITVRIKPNDGTAEKKYNLIDCFPTRWMAPESLGKKTRMVEKMTFVVERVERQ